MARLQGALQEDRQFVQVDLTLAQGGQAVRRALLADTGAGSRTSNFELILDEDDCLLCGGFPYVSVVLGGAYAGSFPVYDLAVQIPALAFDQKLRVVGVPSVPVGLDGIACFRFLNRFTY